MSYTIEDVLRLELPEKLSIEFRKELWPLNLTHRPEYTFENLREGILTQLAPSDYYKDSLRYVLADTVKERAIAAMEAKPDAAIAERILQVWLKYANQMTDFEKTMQGWDKL